MIREEGVGLAEALLEQTPETATAHLRTMAGESGDFLARVFLVRPSDRHL